MTSSYGNPRVSPSPPLLVVRHTNRPTSLPSVSPIYFTRWPVVPVNRATSLSLSFPLSTSVHLSTRAYRCFIGIHYLSTAANKSLPGAGRRLRVSVYTGFGPGDTQRERERGRGMGKKVIRHRNHVLLARGERSNVQIPYSTDRPREDLDRRWLPLFQPLRSVNFLPAGGGEERSRQECSFD